MNSRKDRNGKEEEIPEDGINPTGSDNKDQEAAGTSDRAEVPLLTPLTNINPFQFNLQDASVPSTSGTFPSFRDVVASTSSPRKASVERPDPRNIPIPTFGISDRKRPVIETHSPWAPTRVFPIEKPPEGIEPIFPYGGDDDYESEPDDRFGVETWSQHEHDLLAELVGHVGDYIGRLLAQPPSEEMERALEELDRSSPVKDLVEDHFPDLELQMKELGIGGRVPPGMAAKDVYRGGAPLPPGLSAVSPARRSLEGVLEPPAPSRLDDARDEGMRPPSPPLCPSAAAAVRRSQERACAYAREAIEIEAFRQRKNEIAEEIHPSAAARNKARRVDKMSGKSKTFQSFTEPQDEPDIPVFLRLWYEGIGNQLHHFWLNDYIARNNFLTSKTVKLHRLNPSDIDQMEVEVGVKAMNQGMRLICDEHKRQLSLQPDDGGKFELESTVTRQPDSDASQFAEGALGAQPEETSQVWEVADTLSTTAVQSDSGESGESQPQRRESAVKATLATSLAKDFVYVNRSGSSMKDRRIKLKVVRRSSSLERRQRPRGEEFSVSPPVTPEAVSSPLLPPPSESVGNETTVMDLDTGTVAIVPADGSATPSGSSQPPSQSDSQSSDAELIPTLLSTYDAYMNTTPSNELLHPRELSIGRQFSRRKIREYNRLIGRWIEIVESSSGTGSRKGNRSGRSASAGITVTSHENSLQGLWRALQMSSSEERARQVRRLFYENPFLKWAFVCRFAQLSETKNPKEKKKTTTL